MPINCAARAKIDTVAEASNTLANNVVILFLEKLIKLLILLFYLRIDMFGNFFAMSLST